MRKKTRHPNHRGTISAPGRVLARVLADDLTEIHGGYLSKDHDWKSVSCGENCDKLVDDSAKLWDDG